MLPDLSPEEAAMFGEPPAVAPAPAAPAADEWDWDDAPAPAAPVETPASGVLMPDCAACGASLNPENASKLRTGAWKHLGCPKAALVPSGPPPADMPLPSTTEPPPADYVAPKAAEPAPAPAKRGRKPRAESAPAAAPPAPVTPPPFRAHDHATAAVRSAATLRSDAFDAISGERAYQVKRWPADRNPEPKTVLAYLVYMRDYVEEALHALSREDDVIAVPKALHTVRKVAALGVACMEDHGALKRGDPA